MNLWTTPRIFALMIAAFLLTAALPLALSDSGPGEEGTESPSPSPSESADPEDTEDGHDQIEPTPTSSEASEDDEDAEDRSGSDSGSDEGDDDSGEGSDDSDEDSDEDAKDEDEDERDDHEDDDDEEERRVEVEASEEGVQIKLERETDSTEDKVEIGFETESARFELKLEQENNESEDELKLEARFAALGEYQDANGNGRYDSGEPLLSLWTLSQESHVEALESVPARSISWGSPQTTEIQTGNLTGHKIVVPATFAGDGELQLVLYVFGDYVTLNGSDLRPTSVKIDVVIRDYPFVENDTALALFVQTQSKRELETDHDHDELDDDEEGVAAGQAVDGTNVSLVFAWKNYADVDGVQRPVNSTSIRLVEETESDEWQRKETFVLSYPRGTNITHDPELFVSIQSAFSAGILPGPMGNWLVVGLGVAVAAVGVALTLGPRLRRP